MITSKIPIGISANLSAALLIASINSKWFNYSYLSELTSSSTIVVLWLNALMISRSEKYSSINPASIKIYLKSKSLILYEVDDWTFSIFPAYFLKMIKNAFKKIFWY